MHRPKRPASAAFGSVDVNQLPKPIKPRSESAGPTRGRGANASTAGEKNNNNKSTNEDKMARVAISESKYVQEQLKDILRRQAEVDRRHQEGMLAFRYGMRALYDENAILRNIIAAGERRLRHGGETNPDVPSSVTQAEAEHLSLRTNIAVRKQNRLAHELQLAQTPEALREAARETRRTELVEQGELHANRPLFLRIQKLEKRLDDILGKQQTVQVVLQGYRAHLAALKDEGKHYDVRMESLERELADRHRDHLQLLTLYHNAVDEVERAGRERSAFLSHFYTVREAKEKALGDQKAAVDSALQETQRQERRVAELQQVLEEETQLLEAAENEKIAWERRLLGTAGAAHDDDGEDDGQTAEDEEKLSAYEAAFKAMTAAARVDSMEALVDVFEAESEHVERLQRQVVAQRAARQALQEELKALRSAAEDARVCGLQQPTITNLLEEELRQFIAEETHNYEVAQESRKNSQRLLSDVVLHVNRLAELLSLYRTDVPIRPLRSAEDAELAVTVAVLAQKVLALADDATRGSAPLNPAGTPSTHLVIPEHNVRVRLPRGTAEGRAGGVASMSSAAAAQLLGQRRALRRAASLAGAEGDAAAALVRRPSAAVALDYSDTSSDEHEGERDVAAAAQTGAAPEGRSGSPGATATEGGAGAAARRKRATQPARLGSVSDDPLRREEVKKISEAIESRERKKLEREQRRKKN